MTDKTKIYERVGGAINVKVGEFICTERSKEQAEESLKNLLLKISTSTVSNGQSLLFIVLALSVCTAIYVLDNVLLGDIARELSKGYVHSIAFLAEHHDLVVFAITVVFPLAYVTTEIVTSYYVNLEKEALLQKELDYKYSDSLVKPSKIVFHALVSFAIVMWFSLPAILVGFSIANSGLLSEQNPLGDAAFWAAVFRVGGTCMVALVIHGLSLFMGHRIVQAFEYLFLKIRYAWVNRTREILVRKINSQKTRIRILVNSYLKFHAKSESGDQHFAGKFSIEICQKINEIFGYPIFIIPADLKILKSSKLDRKLLATGISNSLVVGFLLLSVIAFSACSRTENVVTINNYSTGNSNSPIPAKRSDVEVCRARPDDPYVQSNDDESIYTACQNAITSFPDDPEIVYLTAVSALATDRQEEALFGFQKAITLNVCEANYYLADHAWYAEKDLESAESYYIQGASCGDSRAAGEIYSPAEFENSVEPELLKALYTSDIETLNRIRFVNASFVGGFYDQLAEQYNGKDFETCWKTTYFRGSGIANSILAGERGDSNDIFTSIAYEQSLPYLFQILYPELGTQALIERRKSLHESGKAAMLSLVEKSRCGAIAPYKYVKGIELFAKTKKPLLESIKEFAPKVKSLDDLRNILQSKGQSLETTNIGGN